MELGGVNMKKMNKKGFTLLELIVVITIIGLIGGSVTSLLVFGYNVFGQVNEDFQAQVDLRSSLQELSKTMRYAKAIDRKSTRLNSSH